MKTRNIFTIAMLVIVSNLGLFLSSCESEHDKDWETVLFEKPVVDATSTSLSIMYGESVTFTDLSTKVYTREWSFPGGDIDVSSAEEVTVTYAVGGTYIAYLEVTHVDNTKGTLEFTVEVEGAPAPDKYMPSFTESFALYTEYDQVSTGVDLTMTNNNGVTIAPFIIDTYEGAEGMAFEADGSSDWFMASLQPSSGSADISAFADGYYNVAIKSSSDAAILIRLQSSGQKAILEFSAENELYGFKRDGEWHMLEIPIADFLAVNPSLDLAAITDFMVLRSAGGDIRTANNYNFYIDNFFISNGNTPPITFTESFGFYTEREDVTPGAEVTFERNATFVISPDILAPHEGTECQAFVYDATDSWAMASIKPTAGTVDISAFADGYYNLALKSSSNGDILIRLQSDGQKAILEFKGDEELYGFKRDGEWHMLQIPIADFMALNVNLDLTAITDVLVFRSQGDITAANNYDFYLDNFFLSK